jgi:GntR family transcriptional regulator, rspAB operon transcriptional repressor
MSSETVDPKLPITAQVHAALRRAILTMEIRPSTALSEKELSLRFGVSRTPVREALIKLADEGLVDIFPQRGTFVAPIRMDEVLEAQFIREALEAAVIRSSAQRSTPDLIARLRSLTAAQKRAAKEKDLEGFLQLDEAFHRAFSESVGQPRSWRLIQSVKAQLDRVRFLSLPEPGHLEAMVKQHEAIVRAVEAKDADEAERVMRGHLREVFRSTERLLARDPALFDDSARAVPSRPTPASQ